MTLPTMVLLAIVVAVVVAVVRIEFGGLHAAFRCRTASGLTGREIALALLASAGLHTVRVRVVSGFLLDHFDYRHNTVVLSATVANSASVGAASVVAHEFQHAHQHNSGSTLTMWRLARLLRDGAGLTCLPLALVALLFSASPIALMSLAMGILATVSGCVLALIEEKTSADALHRLETTSILQNGAEAALAAKALAALSKTYWMAAVSAPIASIQHFFFNKERVHPMPEQEQTPSPTAGTMTPPPPPRPINLAEHSMPSGYRPDGPNANAVADDTASAAGLVVFLLIMGVLVGLFFLLKGSPPSMGEQAAQLASAIRSASGR